MAIKIWNGSSWTSSTPKYWNGTAWTVPQYGKVWDGSAWTTFYPSVVYNGNITCGTYQYTTGTTPFLVTTTLAGLKTYVDGTTSFGSRSPPTLTDGKTLLAAYDYIEVNTFAGSAIAHVYVTIGGFTSDPGVNYFTRATNTYSGRTNKTSDVYSYVYDSANNRGIWHWYSANVYTSDPRFNFGTSGTEGFQILA